MLNNFSLNQICNFKLLTAFLNWRYTNILNMGFPGGSVVKSLPASVCQCRRRGFDPWFKKIPWRRKWQPWKIPWTEEPGGL